ncbi:MAG: hypothetical protein ACE37F_09035 [Nannocystaceae bacterium]|nr:hypothetical protein [bacterium]
MTLFSSILRALGPAAFVFTFFTAAAATAAPEGVAKETVCDDGKDNDGDLVYDCGDNDCKKDPACASDGQPENTPERCGDWIDNDADGYTDCEDDDCNGSTACYGSWDIEMSGGAVPDSGPAGTGATTTVPPQPTVVAEDDNFGENTNVLCSDGIDNDDDGRVDCEDIGCRLDTQVTICQPSGDFRLSLVGRIEALGYNFEDETYTTEFESLQLRVLGQMPFIQNSFFLISSRVEKTPRVTFALFQVPLGKKGHYLNINSGGGGLSLGPIQSVHKRLLVEQPFYLYNAFEQGNGAAMEFGGPLDKKSKFLYRAFAAGGSGRFAGNIGGTFFPDGNTRYTWSVGGQIWANVIGYYNRWDNPFLYTKSPMTLAVVGGVKYDQRAQERYPGWNAQTIFRYWRFHFQGEYYGKRELEFRNFQNAYNVQLGFLPWEKRLLLAADFGQYLATDFEDPPEDIQIDLRRQLQSTQWRTAAHVYLWRNVFFASAVYQNRREETAFNEGEFANSQEARLLFTYRW